MKRFMSLLFVACVLVACGHAQGGAVVSGFNASALAANDDGSTGLESFGFANPINFYGTTYSGAYLNNNGNLTFTSPLGTYTPFGLTISLGAGAIIAPFFADVDTRNPGSDLMKYGAGTFDGRPAFGVTWDGAGVGYFFEAVDKLNIFQVLLVDRSDINVGDFDIVFNYDQIQWETGDASDGSGGLGGISAAAGYSNGTGVAGTNYQLPGSLVNGALLDGGPNALVSGSLNSGVDGRYVFAVRNGQPIDPIDPNAVPECSSLIVWSLLGICVGCWRKRRRANRS
jgi:hypothetical protein